MANPTSSWKNENPGPACARSGIPLVLEIATQRGLGTGLSQKETVSKPLSKREAKLIHSKNRTQRPISKVRALRATLRAQGLRQSEITILEEIALQCGHGTLKTLRGAYLAKCLGYSPQWANELLRRLDALGLIIRFKTGLLRLNVEKLNNISQRAAKSVRRKYSNWLKTLTKSRRRKYHVHEGKDLELREPVNGYQRTVLLPSAQRGAKNGCIPGYVPLHLRVRENA